jgi:hypothetical protein
MSEVENGSKFPITEFTFDLLVENPAIVMIAKRGSGKSFVCKALIKYFEKVPVGIIISKTDRVDPFFVKFFPDSFIYYDYKSEIIEKLIRRQELIVEKYTEKKKRGKRIDPRAIVIMDDCLASKGSWMRDEPISELLFNGRHYYIMYVLTMQYPLGISPELRTNFDYIFLLADDTYSNIKRMYEHYAGMFPTLDSFRQIFTQLTTDYGCMVINNRGSRKSIFDKIFHYKAPIISNNDIKAGCYQFRKFHEENYYNDWFRRKKDQKLDVANYFAQKKKDKTDIKVEVKDIASKYRYDN